MNVAIRWGALMLLATACHRGTDLVAYRDVDLQITLLDDDGVLPGLPAIHRVQVEFQDCRAMSAAVKATLNGIPIEVDPGGPRTFEGGCDLPTAWADLAAMHDAGSGDAEIELSDATHRITLKLQHLLAPRAAIPDRALAGVHAGDAIHFTWTPSTDVIGDAVGDYATTAGVTEWPRVPTVTATSSGIDVVLTNAPSGINILVLSPVVSMPVIACVGVKSCAFGSSDYLSRSFYLDVAP